MTYLYECPECREVLEPVQSSEGEHQEYPCPCGAMAKRVYTKATAPSMKLNSGFHSDELGVDVKNQGELERLKARQRYMSGMGQYLGDNATPKDEWVDEAAANDQKLTKQAAEYDEKASSEYREYYDKVETFTTTNRKN